MNIRKISVGVNYKDAMHYVVGQKILGNSHIIHDIELTQNFTYKIWIQSLEDNSIIAWKELNQTMPTLIEYNIEF